MLMSQPEIRIGPLCVKLPAKAFTRSMPMGTLKVNTTKYQLICRSEVYTNGRPFAKGRHRRQAFSGQASKRRPFLSRRGF